jgi:DNA-binding transcriptional LysR family regulator
VPLLELGGTVPLRSAAATGTAPAVLSALAAREDLAEGRLVEVPVAAELEPGLTRVLRAVWRPDRPLTAAARRLLRVARGAATD